MKSIRSFLVIVLLSTICLVNFIAALNGYRRSMAEAEQLLDQQLVDASITISELTANHQQVPPDLLGSHRFFQVWTGNQLQQRSANSPIDAPAPLQFDYHTLSFDGQRWRLFVNRSGEQDGWVIVGQRYDMYSRLIEEMVIESILPIIWVLPILGLLIWLIVNSGLRPLRRLAAILNLREPDDLQRIGVNDYPDELATVVISIDQLLNRLSAALDRERRFAANAAHELRTPLAALKINLYNLQTSAEPDKQQITELQSSVERMAHSIEQILTLNRITPEQFRNSTTRCNLLALAQQAVVELYAATHARKQNIALEGDAPAITGDKFSLLTLFKNLIDNASKYTPVGGHILVTLKPDKGGAEIRVEDSGPGISENERDRVFDRFYRIGGDQHNSQVVGCGLGLSIVAHIVALHRGSIALETSPALGGLAVRVFLPSGPQARGR